MMNKNVPIFLAMSFVVAVWITNVHVELSIHSNQTGNQLRIQMPQNELPMAPPTDGTDAQEQHQLAAIGKNSSSVQKSPPKQPVPSAQTNEKDRLAYKRSSKPWFVMHVGPPKTGTTYLQMSLCGRQGYPAQDPFIYLARDNIAYIGTCPGRARKGTLPHHIRHIFSDMDARGNPPVDSAGNPLTAPQIHHKFEALVQRQVEEHRNVLLIFEGLHRLTIPYVKALRKFLEPNFHLRVWVAYRPLYEWLPSKYNSVHKSRRNPSARAWPGQLTPGNITGKILQPFDLDGRGDFSQKIVQPLEEQQLHISHIVLQLYGEQGGIQDAQVIRLPSTQPRKSTSKKQKGSSSTEYLTYVLCNLLNATHTCEAFRQEQLLPSRSVNPSEPFDGDLLAVGAHSLNQLPLSITDRTKVAALAQSFYDQYTRDDSKNHSTTAATSSPLSQYSAWTTCLSNATLERIFQLSWRTHVKLFSLDKRTADNKEQYREEEHLHHVGFAKNRYRFCYANAPVILKSKEWASFLPSIVSSLQPRLRLQQPGNDQHKGKRTKQMATRKKAEARR